MIMVFDFDLKEKMHAKEMEAVRWYASEMEFGKSLALYPGESDVVKWMYPEFMLKLHIIWTG